ncbi:3-hydroxyacyl-CoA dehydrogenase NAD-binding domain-containing protein [Deinococcus maricopensis]|uniref:3-hydroxybutyryl-CoA epimerase n=1 Tax=Deinococcus maricopensis (strain DSM 21211 / LMG 22137 / NRRL B-23946 / LB-34) TaxID=709986 RepID=E8U394_DEIML|nr:3-hydroxyacyl-CoA dehydrogenase NAD-binding domain-containing protein [Deinococcus maricopensis]ADV66039.1 3-hydroxybutyryl-CoA epimerase [Deinococcus maricopensis DSM 21211]
MSIEQQIVGRTLVLTVNNPPVNVLSPGVPEGLMAGLDAAHANEQVQAVVIVGGGRTFIAGADVRTFSGAEGDAPDVRGLMAALDASEKPVIAAIHGTALGGGLEVALACTYRVAVPDAQLGLPEVKLGLLPGAGGTQRLPRLIGVEAALSLMTTGDSVSGAQAHAMGLVDEVITGDLLTGAQAFAERVAAAWPLPRVSERPVNAATVDFAAVRAALQQRARGLASPFLIVDLVEASTRVPFEEGLRLEADAFMRALQTPQSRGLRHAFFAEREAAKINGLPKGTPTRDVRSVAVIGAGTMGGGIAMNFANAGVPVTLVETQREALDRGLAVIRRNYEQSARKGRLTPQQVEERMGLLRPTLDMADIADADLVIEAVFENMDVKKAVFAQLDAHAKPTAMLATNTSTLDVDALAAGTRDPSRVLGMHFFSPANVMKLLEVVRGERTAPDVLATVMRVARTIRKVGVVVGVCDGFVGNRMINAYGREAHQLLVEGASPRDVDDAMHAFGLPMGPFEMSDMAGLDIGYAIRQRHAHEAGLDRSDTVLDRLVDLGRKGQKTGAGVYRYADGRTPEPDAVTDDVLTQYRAEQGVTPRDVPREEITKRLVYQLVNEGARILEEGVAQRASDIDVIYLYGYGFPAYRGGPMRYADEVGLARVLADIRALHAQHGSTWAPAPLLERLARDGQTFTGNA